jgi:hypothetical protein
MMVDDGRGVPLVQSVATEREISDLRGGFCHLHALELHRRHGWRLRGLGRPADEYSSLPFRGLGEIRHVYCLNDEGLPVDVNGLFASEEAIRRFYAHQHAHGEELASTDLTEEDVRGPLYELYGMRPLYREERPYLDRSVERLALHELCAPAA